LVPLAALGMVIAAVLVVVNSRTGPIDDPVRLRDQATQLAGAGRWDESETLLARLKEPTDQDWLLRAFVAQGRDRDDDALLYLAKIPPDGPVAAQVALLTGKLEQRRYRARPMEVALLEAIRLDPKLSEARRLLVYLYGMQERRKELLEQFAALAEQGPVSFDLLYHWWIGHREAINQPADVMEGLERFVASDPDDRWSRIALANAWLSNGDPDRAGQVLATLPLSDPEVRACRGQIEIDRGDFVAADAILAEGPQDHPKLARLRGKLALKRGEAAPAVRFLKIADATDPNNPYALYELMTAHRLTGDHASADALAPRVKAHQALQHFVDRFVDREAPGDRSNPNLLCKVASAFEAAGYRTEARAWYRLAISADPLHQAAQQALFRLSNPAGPGTVNTHGP
jgi:tetratricopeptide (TPR) repeat protein